MSLVRKRLELYPTQSLRLGLGVPAAGPGRDNIGEGRAAARNTGYAPKGQPLCPTLWLGIWRMSLSSGQTSPLNSFPVGPPGLSFLFSGLIPGGRSRQSPRQGSPTSLPSEMVSGWTAAQQRTQNSNATASPTCPKPDPVQRALLPASLGFKTGL